MMVKAEAAVNITSKMLDLMSPEESEDFVDLLVAYAEKHPLDMESVVIRAYRQWSGTHAHKMGMSLEFLRAMRHAHQYDRALYYRYCNQLPGEEVLDRAMRLSLDDMMRWLTIEQINTFTQKIKLENREQQPVTYYMLCQIGNAAQDIDMVTTWREYIGSDTSTYFHEKLNQALYELAQSL